MKFWIVNIKYSDPTWSKLGFKITNKIKVKHIKINNNENMTDWKENESYLSMKFDG